MSFNKEPAWVAWCLNVATVLVGLLAIGCVIVLVVVYERRMERVTLMVLFCAFTGMMYLARRARSLIRVLFLGVVTFMIFLLNAPTVSISRARKLTALATATSIECAVNNFYSEYGSLPEVGSRVRTGSREGFKFLTILLDYEEPTGNLQNERGIRFLNVKEVRGFKGGLRFVPGTNMPDGLFDPWGNPYVVLLDQGDTGNLHFKHGSKTVDLPKKRVAVFSPGKDRIAGNADDVKTWGDA
jgi:hypothetical protein